MSLSRDLELLIGLLATADALFVPFRQTRDNRDAAAAVWERRIAYHRGGLPLIGGGSERERQIHSRALRQARLAGMVRIVGRTRPRVRIAEATETRLRAMTGTYRVAQTWPLLELIDLLSGNSAKPVLEIYLLDTTNYDQVTSDDLAALQLKAAPLLAAGFVETASDIQRRIGYSVTARGRGALTIGPAAEPEDLPQYCAEAADYFDSVFGPCLDERAAWLPENRSHVVIPLSASWPPRLDQIVNA